ncbi:MAG: hypothetical protein HY694_06160 [Deltaproteobacteria bacterium]|nr:hypothetical protein [Deltaproteobacteria bacterium]
MRSDFIYCNQDKPANETTEFELVTWLVIKAWRLVLSESEIWEYGPIKTTIDIPDKTLQRAKSLAAAKGMSLKQLVAQAIEDNLSHGAKTSKAAEPTWMKLYGAFAKTKAMRAETRRIQKLIDEEFGRINPEDWK